MKLKILTSMIAASCLFTSVAFGQNLALTGKVTAVTATQITLVCDGDMWTIKRTGTTTPHKVTVGSTVTVRCKSPDAHKNE
jgi:hypothetical protein